MKHAYVVLFLLAREVTTAFILANCCRDDAALSPHRVVGQCDHI